MFRVFLSSMAEDLDDHRAAVIEALDQIHEVKVLRREALSGTSVAACRRVVQLSDVIVVVVARRYGWVPTVEQGGDGERSITRLEADAGEEDDYRIPKLIFLVDPKFPWTDKQEQDELMGVKTDAEMLEANRRDRLLEEFREQLSGQPVELFGDPKDLAAKVLAAVANERERQRKIHRRRERSIDRERGPGARVAPGSAAVSSTGGTNAGGGNVATPEVPTPISDEVDFTVTTPGTTEPGNAYRLDVWAHVEKRRDEVLERAQRDAGEEGIRPHTFRGATILRSSVIEVTLLLKGLLVDFPDNTMIWDGRLGQASFTFRVPERLERGQYPGRASLHVNGLCIASLSFIVAVSERSQSGATHVKVHRSAFASYASADRDEMLARVQGMQKIAPDLDVFVDVASLRSGDQWTERLRAEIETRNVLYLFWSRAASRSEWVEREWRIALKKHGLDFIDPVPLESPDLVPPPIELGGELHFNDWMLAYMRSADKNESASEPEIPSGWYQDPSDRFDFRYWDGHAWTEHVSRDGITAADPLAT
jgi:hypothetical protein